MGLYPLGDLPLPTLDLHRYDTVAAVHCNTVRSSPENHVYFPGLKNNRLSLGLASIGLDCHTLYLQIFLLTLLFHDGFPDRA